MTFHEFCIQGARQFLQTALVIDDRADLGANQDPSVPRNATRAARPALRRTSTPTTAPETRESSDEDAEQTGIASIPPDASHLNAKALTDAFLATEVICGVHKPAAGDQSVELAVNAAKRADILVVDWYLDRGGSKKARDIIRGVLVSDLEEHGRVRLIAVYTSEPGRAGVGQELFAHLETDDALRGRFELSADGTNVCRPDTRICVINKKGTLESSDVLPIEESDLPGFLENEFVKLTDGLLANFAVSAVAAVRRGAHHVLARFHKNLDGVYIAHRVSLANPAEAEDMALERISVELSSLVENANVIGNTLTHDVIDAWIDHRAQKGHVFKTDFARIPIELMRELVRKGKSRLNDVGGQQQVDRDGAPKRFIGKNNVHETFYVGEAEASAAGRDLTRLTLYKREAGRVRLDGFKPRLTLGTLLRVKREMNPEVYTDIEVDYLLCIQPRCDSVRFAEPRAFPFQKAVQQTDQFNLVIDKNEPEAYLYMDVKPMNTVMLRFKPEPGNDAILARKVDDEYVFSDTSGRLFEWVGDVDDLKAQKFASEVAANLHRVGVDDLEWLRLASKK